MLPDSLAAASVSPTSPISSAAVSLLEAWSSFTSATALPSS